MSYRFLWKQIASKALSSAIASGLLAMNRESLWDRLASTESFDAEQIERLRQEIEKRLHDVAQQGEKERELMRRVVDELVRTALGRGGDR